MSYAKGLCGLPTELVLQIFDYLNPEEICSLSETCTKFKDLIDDSDQLVSKLTLYFDYPNDAKKFADTMKRSTRKYRNLRINRTIKNEVAPLIPSEIFGNLTSYIRTLELNWHGYNTAMTEKLQIKMLESNIMPERQSVRLQLIFNRDQHDNFLRSVVRTRRHELMNILDMDEDDVELPEFHVNVNNDLDSIERRATIIQGLRLEIKKIFFMEFAAVIGVFTNVETLRLLSVSNLEVPNDFEAFENLSSVREIHLNRCDISVYKLISACCENVIKLSNICPLNNFMTLREVSAFDIFLASLKNLKELTMSNVRNFFRSSDLVAKFKLEKLKLHDVFFPNQSAAENFFQFQDQLKHIDLEIKNEYTPRPQLEGMVSTIQFDDILKMIFASNKSLETVKLYKANYRLNNCDSLKYLINPKVRTFTYQVTAEDTEVTLFKTLSRNFPNVEKLEFTSEGGNITDNCTCFNDSRIFNKVRSIKIINSTVSVLPNIFANNLEYFEFSPARSGEFIDDYIGGFFHRHRGIKHLVIGTKTLSSMYFFVSFNLCQLIVNFLSDLDSITIYNFAEINKSVKLLCMLPKLQTLIVAKPQYEQFTKKTIDECEKRLLKVIPI